METCISKKLENSLSDQNDFSKIGYTLGFYAHSVTGMEEIPKKFFSSKSLFQRTRRH